jgi:hypothetical protein
MRWDALFADLEAQLSAAGSAELSAEVAERSRAQWARTELPDRLRAIQGQPVQLLLHGGERVSGVCADAAPQWVVVDLDRGQVLVPLSAVAAVGGLGRRVAPPAGQVLRRLGLGHALRALARDRVPVRVLTRGGWLSGTIDRVGADHLDLAEHATGEPRRSGAVRGVLTVPFAALCAVHST